MNTFIVHPKTIAQQEAVRAALEALNVDFESDESEQGVCILPPNVVEQVKKSEEQFKEGKWYSHQEVMSEYSKYL